MTSTFNWAVLGLAVLTLACDARREDAYDNNENSASIAAFGAHRDAEFVEDSLQSGMLEVELGRMAQQKAASPEVKQFAEMMVRDHTRAGTELRQVAQQHSVATEVELEDEHRDLVQRLAQLSGAEFDREYMNAMVERHQDAVDHLEGRADDRAVVGTTGSDDAVDRGLSGWASKTLPTVEHHLDEARRIDDSLDARMTQDYRR